jgi:hypothetical protein
LASRQPSKICEISQEAFRIFVRSIVRSIERGVPYIRFCDEVGDSFNYLVPGVLSCHAFKLLVETDTETQGGETRRGLDGLFLN